MFGCPEDPLLPAEPRETEEGRPSLLHFRVPWRAQESGKGHSLRKGGFSRFPDFPYKEGTCSPVLSISN